MYVDEYLEVNLCVQANRFVVDGWYRGDVHARRQSEVEASKRDLIICSSLLSMYQYIVVLGDEKRPTRRQEKWREQKSVYVCTYIHITYQCAINVNFKFQSFFAFIGCFQWHVVLAVYICHFLIKTSADFYFWIRINLFYSVKIKYEIEVSIKIQGVRKVMDQKGNCTYLYCILTKWADFFLIIEKTFKFVHYFQLLSCLG